jgi:virulence factor Mce-like protein
MRGRTNTSIVASPVLVGAVTVLVVIVGVFLAYNANQGLPFVPTYELKAELPGGQKLVRGNDVRIGGFRVGMVDDIRPATKTVNGKTRAIAIVNMKLEKQVEPLATDTQVYVRPRSALGLKYIELTPGKASQTMKAGDTVPLSNRAPTVEYEDVFSTFDAKTRENSRGALKGFGDAFAGRGPSINQAIASLNPFFTHLTPVMKTLSEPDTHLDNFFKNIGRASAEAAPVASVQAELFAKMATTFDAFNDCPACLQQTIEKSPEALATGEDSFRVQRPFLADFTALSHDLRPVVSTLDRKLPTINSALETGTPVLRRTVRLNELTGDVFKALDDLAQNPSTLLALKDLRTTFVVARPLLEYVAPFQTVCNNANAFFSGLSTHMANGVANGTSEVVLVRSGTHIQEHNFASSESERPADVPSNYDPQLLTDAQGEHYQLAHLEPYSPAVDSQGRADCQSGQYGYLDGPYNLNPKYGPVPLKENATPQELKAWESAQGGGSHTTTRNDHPGLAGPTFVGSRLGINSLDDLK